VRDFERSPNHGATTLDVLRPRHLQRGETQANEALESTESPLFDQPVAEIAEAPARFEVAELPCGYEPEVLEGGGRGVVHAVS
jgi:hypothetical protein